MFSIKIDNDIVQEIKEVEIINIIPHEKVLIDKKEVLKEKLKYKDDQLIIAESGIHNFENVKKMNECGINTFLVGESFMTSKDPINKFKEIFKN